MTDDISELLQARADINPAKGAAEVWQAAEDQVGRARRRTRTLFAAAVLILVAVGGAASWARRDTGTAEIGPAADTPGVDGAATGPDGGASLCEIVVLNANGETGVAARAAQRITEYLQREGYLQSDGSSVVRALTARTRTAESAVLIPDADRCDFVGLSADLRAFPEPTLAPWPTEFAAAVPEAISPDTVFVVLGENLPSGAPLVDQVIVPAVLGLTLADATDIMEALGFSIEAIVGPPDGLVTSQSPPPSVAVDYGATVLLGFGVDVAGDDITTSTVDSLDDIEVVDCTEPPDVEFVPLRSYETPAAPRAGSPSDAAKLFLDWFPDRSADLGGYELPEWPTGWAQIVAPEGTAFGWIPLTVMLNPSLSHFPVQLHAETNGTEWWIAGFTVEGC